MSPVRPVVGFALVLLLSGCISGPAPEPDGGDLGGPGAEPFEQEPDEPSDEWVGHEITGPFRDTDWAYYAVDRYEAGGGCPGDHMLEAVASNTSNSGFVVRFPVPGCWIEGRVHANESIRLVSAYMQYMEETITRDHNGSFILFVDDERIGALGGSGPPGGSSGMASTKTRPAGDHTLLVVSDQEPGDVIYFDRFEITPWTEAGMESYGDDV